MTAKPPTDRDAAPNSPPAAQTASEETLIETVRRLIAGNPRFREAKPSSKAFVIIGARPPRPLK